MAEKDQAPDASDGLDLIWGVASIAKAINRTTRQASHMCAKGAIPARKIEGRWCVDRDTLRRFFKDAAA